MPVARRDFNRKRFSMENIFGDPFALSTVTLAIAAWLIAFVASIFAALREAGYPNYSWWSLAYMFMVIIGVLVAVAADAVYTYHVAIVGFCAAGLVFASSSANSLIYSNEKAHEAAAAGFILLSMVTIVWMLYYGAQPAGAARGRIDSFALQRDGQHPPSRTSRQAPQSTYRPETTLSHQPPMYTSAQLSGFETSSPVTGYPGGAPGAMDSKRNSRLPPHPMQQQSQAPQHLSQATTPTAATAPHLSQGAESSNQATEQYPYRAKAIYSYEANPEDANEISFSKHEILEVSDVSGRWWQAKKENGETGIAPSNYLILL